MPPPQPVLASKLRGFVCTSCRTKLKLQQQTRWLSRSLASQSTPGYQKGLQSDVKKPKSRSEPVFRFFEETPDGRRKEIEDDDDFMGLRDIPEDPLSKEVDASIAAINKEMKGKKGGIMSKLKEMLAPLSPEEQERMLEEKIRTEIGEEALQDDDFFEVPSDPNAFIVPLTPYGNILLPDDTQPRSYRTKIAELNERIRRVWDVLPEILKKSEKKEIASLCKGLWRSYVLCRRALLSEPQEIPEHTWWLFWEVFSTPAEWNVERLAHVKILAEDMKLAGRALPDPAGVLYMEAIFVSGDHEQALDLWSKAEDPFDESSESFKEYWELGARMLAKVGEIDRAVQAAEISLGHSSNETDARILLPIIQSCFVSDTAFAIQKAWALYQRLRLILGEQIEMKDYDAVISFFLNANETDLALSVFTDMMLTGDKTSLNQDSTTAYKRAIAFGSDLRSLRIERKELSWEKSQVLAKLPQKFNNKFFFGSWMKKLIGDGELKFAEKVLDIMYERGITPDAHYLNGMIGAWLREGTIQGQQKAEEMAWRMIKIRLDFVKTRNQSSRTALWKPNAVSERPAHKSLILERTPKATIETFSILLENYRRRQKNEQLEFLYGTLREAQIRPNTFFMNQLLSADLRGGEKHWAWDKYTFLVQEQDVTPDFDTFQCLWHIMRKQVDPLVTRKDKNYTNCRELFAEMVKYAGILTKRAQMPRELYDLILLSFGLADDQVGTAIALRGLRRSFNMYPNPTTARTVILQLSRIGRRNTAGFRPRRLKLDPATKDRIDQVTKILEAFKNQRVKALAEKGVVFDELSGEVKSEESLVLLCDLLQYVAEARIEGLKDGSRGLDTLTHQVAEEMGMPGCIPWRGHEDGNSETRSPLSSSE